MAIVEFTDLFKVFGPDPAGALARFRAGADRDALREAGGHTVALADISLAIAPGEIFVVMGLSGSGKSTLVRLINRLIRPTSGQVRVAGADVGAMTDSELTALRRHRISMVFQHFGLMPHRTVLDNVAYGLAIQKQPRSAYEATARRWVETVGLSGFETAWPDELSGGMRQRVGLARALATDPDILLMDEPFSALDPLIRRDMQDQLLALQGDLTKTIVFITHDLDEALRLGDRIAILKDGALAQLGTPEEILLAPASDYVAAFLRDVNRGRVLTASSAMQRTPPQVGPGQSSAASIAPETPLETVLPLVAVQDVPVAVVDADGAVLGTVSRQDVIALLVPK